jgi:hypothetical protein
VPSISSSSVGKGANAESSSTTKIAFRSSYGAVSKPHLVKGLVIDSVAQSRKRVNRQAAKNTPIFRIRRFDIKAMLYRVISHRG